MLERFCFVFAVATLYLTAQGLAVLEAEDLTKSRCPPAARQQLFANGLGLDSQRLDRTLSAHFSSPLPRQLHHRPSRPFSGVFQRRLPPRIYGAITHLF